MFPAYKQNEVNEVFSSLRSIPMSYLVCQKAIDILFEWGELLPQDTINQLTTLIKMRGQYGYFIITPDIN
jgi:hypothetical protein